MRKQFASTLYEMMKTDENICVLLGDIGVFGFRKCFEEFPTRTYNIGILEQSMISLAAGLSKTDLIPVVHTITPFIVERALEQIKVDFGYQKLNGNFISVGNSYDYAGLGCTHHCPGDIAILSSIPGIQLVAPGNDKEFNPKNLIDKFDSVVNCYKNLKNAGGYDVRLIDHMNTHEPLLNLIREYENDR
jgi:transketolase